MSIRECAVHRIDSRSRHYSVPQVRTIVRNFIAGSQESLTCTLSKSTTISTTSNGVLHPDQTTNDKDKKDSSACQQGPQHRPEENSLHRKSIENMELADIVHVHSVCDSHDGGDSCSSSQKKNKTGDHPSQKKGLATNTYSSFHSRVDLKDTCFTTGSKSLLRVHSAGGYFKHACVQRAATRKNVTVLEKQRNSAEAKARRFLSRE